MLLYRIIIILLLLMPAMLSAKTKVVTSTADLAYFAKEIGGEYVDVISISSPISDVHFIEVRPSYMVKISRADLVLKIGLELDMWMDQLIDGSRNNKLTIMDCSKYVTALEVPTFKADARYGDLHRFGNPHYWLGPINVEPIIDVIVEGLTQVDPEHKIIFKENRQRFLTEIKNEMGRLEKLAEPLANLSVIFYHNSWPYFNQFTGMKAENFIEPYPGVQPSPSHIKELIEQVKSRNIKVIAVEPYFDKRVPNKIAAESNAKVVTLYPSIGGQDKDESYLQWLEGNINTLLEAIK